MATSGREPESAEQDATTLRDGETEITLLGDEVAIVATEGLEIVVDDRTEVATPLAADAPPARGSRIARPLVVATAVVITIVVAAFGAAALRDDGGADVSTDPASPTRDATTPSTARTSVAPTTLPAASAPATDPPAAVPPATSPPATSPATQPPATQPTTPPTTHSPTDYTGLTRTLSSSSLQAAPGGTAGFSLTYRNTSSWTMRVPMPPCAYVVPTQVCVAGFVEEELAPGASITRALSVTAPTSAGSYQVRVTNVAGGELTLSLAVG